MKLVDIKEQKKINYKKSRVYIFYYQFFDKYLFFY